MWVIAGVLLGLVVLASLIGFHVGPHAHLAAGVLGVLAAAWLVVMAVDGRSAPVLWALLSADLIVSAGIATLAWKGLTSRGAYVAGRHLVSPDGAEGVAVGNLDPEGIVRVNGENWSAVERSLPSKRAITSPRFPPNSSIAHTFETPSGSGSPFPLKHRRSPAYLQ